jgi:mannose/fructose/N-acetylgalactosamine-specific phosphotransferase system component IIC
LNGGVLMDLNMFFGVLSFILRIVKEVLIIFILVKGIQIANIYLKKNKNDKVEDNKEDNKKDNTEDKEDK